jgi:glycerate kinase
VLGYPAKKVFFVEVASATGVDLAGSPGAGAAGGTRFAAIALLNASLGSGIDLVLDLVEFAT